MRRTFVATGTHGPFCDAARQEKPSEPTRSLRTGLAHAWPAQALGAPAPADWVFCAVYVYVTLITVPVTARPEPKRSL